MRSIRISGAAAVMVCLLSLLNVADLFGQRNAYWKQRTTLFDLLPIEKDDIVFLGNSITDGGEWSELFNNEKLKNRGISGDVISGIKERLYQVVDGKPGKIFLLVGINDVSHNLTAERILSEYEDLVKEIREKTPETRLYIQSIMPIDNGFNRYKALIGKENVVTEINNGLPEIARKYGATYIDLWPALSDRATGKLKKKFTNDGLHLTGAGYAAWVDAIRGFVEE